MSKKNNLGVLDFETDPFKRGRLPKPFIAGLLLSHEGERRSYKVYIENDNYSNQDWLKDLIEEMSKFHGYIYAHNGGRFDFIFILDKLLEMGIEVKEFKMIKSRIAKIGFKNVTLVDSFLLLPVPLKATGQKEEFEYWKTEKSVADLTEEQKQCFQADRACRAGIPNFAEAKSPRVFYMPETCKYLKQDCVGALDTIEEFIRLYGFGLTLAGRAFNVIKETGYELPRVRGDSKSSGLGHETYADLDRYFRKWFFGGRVQTFEQGTIEGNLHYYDINSAYPYAMTFKHWYGDCEYCYSPEPQEWLKFKKQVRQTSLLTVKAHSLGAFPVRKKDGGICFPEAIAEFNVTGWEFEKARELGIVKDWQVLKVWTPVAIESMGKFVRKVHKRKQQAEKDENPIQRLIHKLVMNSGYGRFAIDPSDWKDHKVIEVGQNPYCEEFIKLALKFKLPRVVEWIKNHSSEKLDTYFDVVSDHSLAVAKGMEKIVEQNNWELSLRLEELGVDIYEKPSPDARAVYHSVCTAASITGFVRSMLLEAIASTDRPLYCDTDSMICDGEASLSFGNELGQWKEEAKGPKVHIVAKKIYAFEQENGEYKIASKGVKFDENDIIKAAKGETVTWKNEAPSYSYLRYSTKDMEELAQDPESDDFRKVFIERSITMREPDKEFLEYLEEDETSTN